MAPIRTSGFDHIHVGVGDVDAALAFYRAAFGAEETFRVEDLDLATEEVVRAGGSVLERGEHAAGVPYADVSDPDGNVIEL